MKTLVFGDVHIPFHDKKKIDVLIKIIRDYQPDNLIDLGDSIDAACLSVYDKDHSQLVGLQQEFDIDHKFRQQIKDVSPSSIKFLLECNHLTKRLNKIKKNNIFLDDLRSLKQQNLMNLEETGWVLKHELIQNNVLFMHGDGGMGSGSVRCPINKARRDVKDSGLSVVRGHTHVTGMEVHFMNDKLCYAVQLGTFQRADKTKYIQHKSLSNLSCSILTIERYHNENYFSLYIFQKKGVIFHGKYYEY